jgi:hypothetical protein
VTTATEACPNRHDREGFLCGSKCLCLSDVLILTKESGLARALLEYQQINWPGCEFLPKEGLDMAHSGLRPDLVFDSFHFNTHAAQRLNLHCANQESGELE